MRRQKITGICAFADGVRGGFANAFSTVSKYEINPEEIKVNFSDVRGVSRDSVGLRWISEMIDHLG